MKELQIIQSELNAPKNQYNNFGKYRYRSCEDILAALKPLLKQHGCTLTISDDILHVGDRYYIKATATLSNAGGEQSTTSALAREEDSKKGMDASQLTGTASSYARKYALNGLFAIDDTKDADALNVSKNYTKTEKPEQTEQTEGQISPEDLFEAYAKPAIEQATTKEELVRIFNDYQVLHGMKDFMSAMTDRKKKLGIGKN